METQKGGPRRVEGGFSPFSHSHAGDFQPFKSRMEILRGLSATRTWVDNSRQQSFKSFKANQ